MLVYILRRLSQTGLVLLLTSMLVFAGLFLIGDPIEILVSPEADQVTVPVPVSGWISLCGRSTCAFSQMPRVGIWVPVLSTAGLPLA